MKKYPNNADLRPKRRRDKYNPYTIYSVGEKTDDPHFYVAFTDPTREKVATEICKEIFELLDQFELEDLSYLKEIDRHHAYSDESESKLHLQVLQTSPEDVFKYDDLHAAINKLTEKQRKRIKLYYFDGLPIEEIAKIEKPTFRAVRKSIVAALKTLRTFKNL